MWKSKYISLIIAGLLFSCGDDSNSSTPGIESEVHLVSATAVNEIPIENLQALATLSGMENFAALVQYGVTTYRLVYRTEFNGEPIEASGLLYLPTGMTTDAPLISLQHGTTFVKDDAPSVNEGFTGTEYFASAGYIAMMPDFIGYGESAEIFHPYYDERHSAYAVIDMIQSVKEFLTREKIGFTDQLFLAGYSEGGYVTLAAAKEIETNRPYDLQVTAVAAGAGGYDLEGMLKSIVTGTHYAYPSYLAFVLMSYNHTYEWNKPLDYFFKNQYAAALETYMTGEYGGSFINGKLTTDIQALLNADFYQRLNASNGESELKGALKDNSVSGWKTTIPMQLYHGTKDEIIPYQNSETTLENFNSAGSENVSLTLIPGGTHGNSFVPMLQQCVPWFQSMR